MDQQESDLGILDLIQVFVEALDRCFENVCELDLIFHSDKVHHILDEIIMGGMVLETNISNIMNAIHELERIANASLSVGNSNTTTTQLQTTDFAGYLTSFISAGK